MNVEIKKKWTAALRSGEFKQGREGLVINGDSYCCLGVLGAVLGGKPAGHCMEFKEEHTWGGAYLPIGVTHPIHLSMREQIDLAKMNDQGATFPQIADHIDAHL